MSEKPLPALKVLDAEPVGFCEPDNGYCGIPALQPRASGSADETGPTENVPPG